MLLLAMEINYYILQDKKILPFFTDINFLFSESLVKYAVKGTGFLLYWNVIRKQVLYSVVVCGNWSSAGENCETFFLNNWIYFKISKFLLFITACFRHKRMSSHGYNFL
jgi:hypothetical protein